MKNTIEERSIVLLVNNINRLQIVFFRVIPTFTAISMLKIGTSIQSYPHFLGKVIPVFCRLSQVAL